MFRLNQLRILLLPFSWIFGLVIFIRKKLYDFGWLKVRRFPMPLICIGNLAVGGSGKTPHTEYLYRLLAPSYRLGILSRGYGRKSKGFLEAAPGMTSRDLGDEPMQYFNKLKKAVVAVSEDRVYGVQQLQAKTEVVLLDDAFQHRAIEAGLNILLFDYEQLLKPDFLLPAGNQRDLFASRKRAHVFIVTKCPADISAEQQQNIELKLKPLARQALYFSTLKYKPLQSVFTADAQMPISALKDKAVFLLSGIANPKPMITFVASQAAALQTFTFPDHYDFKTSDIENLLQDYNRSAAAAKLILCTEKDAQRLQQADIAKLLTHLPVYYLPIEVDMVAQKQDFDTFVLKYVQQNAQIRI